jgi:hypothetical protein
MPASSAQLTGTGSKAFIVSTNSFCGLLDEEVRSGLVHAPVAVRVVPGSAYYFAKPRGKPVHRALAQFERWLIHEAHVGA